MRRTTAVGQSPAPRSLVVAAIGYTIFVVYGSMVPLDYHSRPLGEAWSTFTHIWEQQHGSSSRSDWAANLVLLLPLPFLWLGACNPRRVSTAAVSSVLVWVLCLLFSFSIEFGQIFFPPRNPSVQDILAQAVGSALGIAVWWLWGAEFRRAIERWRIAKGPARVAQAILWPYVVILFLYNLMPLDLTVSPLAILQKWREGRIVLAPFGHHGADLAMRLYGLATDVAVWIPVAALLVLGGKRTASRAWMYAVAAATLVEGTQVLVFTRVADVTDILTAMLGGGIGALIGAEMRRRTGASAEPRASRSGASFALVGLAGAFLWPFALVVLFWQPFDFQLDRSFVLERLPMLWRVPFQAYWTGSEFQALTEVIHKVLFFAPLGGCLALACGALKEPRIRAVASIGAVFLISIAAFGVELGQVFLPSKVPDSTDVLLEAVGGLLGFWLVARLRTRMNPRADGVEDAHPHWGP